MTHDARTRPPARRRRARLVALLLACASLAATVVLGTAAPAAAHATLVESDPAEGAVLAVAPDRIRLTFSEPVTLAPHGAQVFDATGELVPSSAETAGPELSISLDEAVDDGTLVVAWRVASADGHPVSGVLLFSVGAPSAEIAPLPPGPDEGRSWLLSLDRWVGYLSLLLTGGLVVFLALLLPADRAARRARERLLRVARIGARVAAVTWVLALPLTAMYRFGGGPGILTDGATWVALAPLEYGVTAAVALGAVASVRLADGGRPAERRRARRRDLAALTAAGVALCAPAFAGHTRAASLELVAIGADVLHLVAGGVWFGGLVALVLVLPDLAGRSGTLAADTLVRFSTVAAGLLVALVATGGLLAWQIAGSWAALVGTPYGWLLLAKVLIALVAVGVAAANRFVVLPKVVEAARRKDRRAGAAVLVRYTAVEAAALVVALLLTGLLVDTSPRSTASERTSVQSVALGDLEVRATLEPPLTGPARITIEMFDAAGEPTEGMDTPLLWLSSDEVDLGAVEMTSVAPGAYAGTVALPSAGLWTAEISLRTGEHDNPIGFARFTVRERDGGGGP